MLPCAQYLKVETGAYRKIRPVALTSHLIKIFEKCARNKIVAYMEDHHLLKYSQYGFRKGRNSWLIIIGSCTTWPREGIWMSCSLILPKHLTKLTTVSYYTRSRPLA